MSRRLLILGGAIFLAIGGTIGAEIISSSGQLCAAPAKASFAEDVMPIFVKKKLSTCDRDAIRAWIREGAKDN